jgi:hypothetical protein
MVWIAPIRRTTAECLWAKQDPPSSWRRCFGRRFAFPAASKLWCGMLGLRCIRRAQLRTCRQIVSKGKKDFRHCNLQLGKTSFLLIVISILPKPRYPFLSLLRNGNQAPCASNISSNPRHFVANIEYLLLTVLVLKLVAFKAMFTSNWRPCHLFRKSFVFFSKNGSIYSSV